MSYTSDIYAIRNIHAREELDSNRLCYSINLNLLACSKIDLEEFKLRKKKRDEVTKKRLEKLDSWKREALTIP